MQNYNTMEDAKLESGNPPEYEAALPVSGQPPSYDSLYGEIKEARKKASGNGDFLKSFCFIIFNTIGATIALGLLLALPILAIVVGALNLDRCPINRFIPIWLIVSGSFAAFQQITALGNKAKKKKNNSEEEEGGDESDSSVGKCACFNSLVGCFQFAWFITGCVWVYKIYAPVTDPTAELWCDYTTYYLAFWLLTLVFILLGFMIFCMCCVVACISAAS